MAIDRAQVRHVARLARLQLTPAEEERFAAQLSNVLAYIEKLAGIDVAGVVPLAFAGEPSAEEAVAALRPDVQLPGLPRERALAAAPAHDGASFLVPRILE